MHKILVGLRFGKGRHDLSELTKKGAMRANSSVGPDSNRDRFFSKHAKWRLNSVPDLAFFEKTTEEFATDNSARPREVGSRISTLKQQVLSKRGVS